MRTFLSVPFLLATACSAPQVLPPPMDKPTAALAALVATPDPTLAGVAWLTGTWATRDLGGLTTETWGPPRAGLMLGHGQSIQGGKTAFFENLRIENKDGQLLYIASPNGGPSTTFTQVSLAPQEAVFADPTHDFPQKIRYRRHGDVLRVRLEGTTPAGDKIIEFAMRRVGEGCL